MTERPYSPGLEGVIAGETSLALVDGTDGRLLYRGYPIGELAERGSFAQVCELLWTGEWPVLRACRRLVSPTRSPPSFDSCRPTPTPWTRCARRSRPGGRCSSSDGRQRSSRRAPLTAFAPSALSAFARLREGLEPIDRGPTFSPAAAFLYQLRGELPDEPAARALDAYFVVAAEHGFNASTFTARVITATRSDLASAVVGAIGALKGPLHGGAPSEVVNQLHEMGSVKGGEAWMRAALARGERLMGFGHRVYRAYDPRAAALRTVAEGLTDVAGWLEMAVRVEEVALRVLAELKPGRVIKTNVEYYAAAVLQGVGLPPNLFPATFALARHAGMDRALPRAGCRQSPDSTRRALRRAAGALAAGLTPRPAPVSEARRPPRAARPGAGARQGSRSGPARGGLRGATPRLARGGAGAHRGQRERGDTPPGVRQAARSRPAPARDRRAQPGQGPG